MGCCLQAGEGCPNAPPHRLPLTLDPLPEQQCPLTQQGMRPPASIWKHAGCSYSKGTEQGERGIWSGDLYLYATHT